MRFHSSKITYLGETNYRPPHQKFGIYQEDRMLHMLILGQSGTGKSTLLKNMIYQDIIHNRGLVLIEPHGDLSKEVLDLIPEDRKQDLVFISPNDPTNEVGYNPFRKVDASFRALVTAGILDAFKKLFAESWGNKLEHILRFVILSLLEQPSATIEDIHRILLDKNFRYQAIGNIQDECVKRFWKLEFNKYTPFDLTPIYNKIGSFISYSPVRRVLIEQKRTISIRRIMDEGKILLINLSKGEIGHDPCQILGSFLLASLSSAAFSRASIEEASRKPFHVFVDEQQNFSVSLTNMLPELRKFSISLTLANQHLQQLDRDTRESILGNVSTRIYFRLGHMDARTIAPSLKPYFNDVDLLYLPNYHINLILNINGKPSHPFSARTLHLDNF